MFISAAIVVQFYLAGYRVFAFKGVDPFLPHFVLGDLRLDRPDQILLAVEILTLQVDVRPDE